MTTQTYTIDAKGKKLGRVATEAAHVLMGKHETNFARNRAGEATVVIENAAKLSFGDKKPVQKNYLRYSGYPGGLHASRMEEVLERKGAPEVLRRAIKGMLPKNRLQAPRLKRLTIHN